MDSSKSKGNNPERWEKLLIALDDKLQLGLLDHLNRIASYHFEAETLYIEPGSDTDREYLTRNAVATQLQVFANDILGVEKVKIK